MKATAKFNVFILDVTATRLVVNAGLRWIANERGHDIVPGSVYYEVQSSFFDKTENVSVVYDYTISPSRNVLAKVGTPEEV